MNNEKWAEALNEISDEHIAEAANPKRKRKFPWFGAIAASLAAIMLVGLLGPLALLPILFQGAGSAAPQDPTGTTGNPQTTPPISLPPITIDADPVSLAAAARNQDFSDRLTVRSQIQATKAQRSGFFRDSTRLVLEDADGNALWSPVSAYLALAMTARLADGETRQELLGALDAESLEALTAQAAAVWETIYSDGDYDKCLLAGSVWLDETLAYDQDVMDDLAHSLYTSVYRADLGAPEANIAIQSWVNANTGNLLTDATQGIELPDETVLALYSTIWFQAKWSDAFHPACSTDGVFHSPGGDTPCTFMNQEEKTMRYCWGEDFGAVSLYLRNGCTMWFILPDEGVSVDQLLESGDYLTMATAGYDSTVQDYNWRDYANIKVNLSVPKFDISDTFRLDPVLEEMGIRQAFSPVDADFSEAFPDSPVWLTGVRQAVRVAIDEEGATAAAYTEENLTGMAPPPEEIMDFVLDRPFLFIITREDIPLFVGVVNEP